MKQMRTTIMMENIGHLILQRDLKKYFHTGVKKRYKEYFKKWLMKI